METLNIGKPKIEKLDNRARLCSKISENGKPSYTPVSYTHLTLPTT